MKIIPSKDGTKFGLVVSKRELQIMSSWASVEYPKIKGIMLDRYHLGVDSEEVMQLWRQLKPHVGNKSDP